MESSNVTERQWEWYFNFRMVWGDTKANKAIGYGESFVHVNFCVGKRLENAEGRVEACWSGADDGDAEGEGAEVCGNEAAL